MPSEVSTSKPKRRVPVKPSCRQDEPKTKLTLYIAADLAKRFAVHATYSDMDKSELFAAMIREHCRRFVVSDRAKFPDEATGDVSA